MCLREAQTHENNKIYRFIRMVGLYFELLMGRIIYGNSKCQSIFRIVALFIVVYFFAYRKKIITIVFPPFLERFFEISNYCPFHLCP